MSFDRRQPAYVHGAFGVLAALSLLAFGASGPVGSGVTLTLISAGVAASVLHDLLKHRAASRPIWLSLLLGFLFLTANNALWLVTVDLGDRLVPPPPWAQVAMVLGYLGLLAAAFLMLTPSARQDLGGVLDAITVGVGGAVLLWTIVLTPALDAVQAPLAERAYALTVVLILCASTGALLRAAVTSVRARPSLLYFLVAVVMALAGNVLRVTTVDPVTGVVPSWIAGVWTVAYLAAWAAAAHPSSAAIAHLERAVADRLSGTRIAVLGLALVAGPVIGVVYDLTGMHTDRLLIGISQVVLVSLVLGRVAQLGAAHAESAERLADLADHDPLTGLSNRRAVDHRLDDLVARIDEGTCPGAVVLFIDLDDFKSVNDRLGHHVGDELLTAVADRLSSCVRRDSTDLAGRLGGDEFILVLEGDPAEMASPARERVATTFDRPFALSSHTLDIRASIGLASAGPADHVTSDDLLSRSDHAMYQDKRSRVAATILPDA